MKIIVFGGSGFLGSHVSDKLSDAGHNVTIFDISESKWLRRDQNMIVGDILDADRVNEAVKGNEVVFNFAGIADIGDANKRPIDTVKYNILGNTILLEAAVLQGVKRFVYASTAYVYSKSGGFYRCSKQSCELYIENFSEVHDLDYIIMRYGSLYGPRADNNNAIYNFVGQALRLGEIKYYGTPNALREYIHVEDAALCSLEILEDKYRNENILITGHQAMKVGDVLKMIKEILGKDIELKFECNSNSAHYEVTPYSFSPKMGKKLTIPYHEDLGQGILRIVEERYKEIHQEFHEETGLLISDGE